jgi:hypothetical protein
MNTPITIRLADERDFPPMPEVIALVDVLVCPRAHHAAVLELAHDMGITRAAAFEMVEEKLEAVFKRRHYQEHGAARVSMCRIFKKDRERALAKIEKKQLSLFK